MPYENPEQKRQYDHNYYQTHHYSVADETGSHFKLQHPDGGTFKVPKKGLSTRMMKRISGLPRITSATDPKVAAIPHMAEGGEAQTALPNPKEAAIENAIQAVLPTSNKNFQAADLGAGVPTHTGTIMDLDTDLEHTKFEPSSHSNEEYNQAALRILAAPALVPLKALGEKLGLLDSPQEQQLPDLQPETAKPNQRVVGMPDQTKGLPEQASVPNLAGIGFGPSGPLPGEGETTAGMKAHGQIMSEEQKHVAEVAQQRQEGLAKISADTQKFIADRTNNSQKLFDDIMRDKVDPNNYWNSKSTGQRITAGIAMVLGGYGAGLSGGENVVMKNINAAIDRDLEAQRMNLGKKQTLLSHYMGETKDLLAAKQLAKADYLDISAAQLMQTAAQSGSKDAIAQAQIEVGKWKTAAYQLRVDVGYKQADLSMKGLDYQLKLRELRMQQMQLGVLGQMVGGDQPSGQPQTSGAPQAPGGLRGGVKIDERALEYAPAIKARALRLADGTYALAKDPTQAKELSDFLEGTEGYQRTLNAYTQLLRAHPAGIWDPTSRDWGRAESLHGQLISEISRIQKLQRLTNVEIDEIYDPMIPKIWGPTLTDRAMGDLQGAQDMLDYKTTAAARNKLSTKLPGITR